MDGTGTLLFSAVLFVTAVGSIKSAFDTLCLTVVKMHCVKLMSRLLETLSAD